MNRKTNAIDPLIQKQQAAKPPTDFDAIIADERRLQAHFDAKYNGKITNGGQVYYDVVKGADGNNYIVRKLEADPGTESVLPVGQMAAGTVVEVDFTPTETEVPVHIETTGQNFEVAS